MTARRVAAAALVVLCLAALGLAMRGSGVHAEAPLGHYEISGTEVRDTRTGLVWSQTISPMSLPYSEAASFCSDMGAGWRLPTVLELASIVDDARAMPAIDPTAFPSTPSQEFWTVTQLADATDNAWHVDFRRGFTDISSTASANRVRCVR